MNDRAITVIDYLKGSVSRCPDKVVFSDENHSFTYRELDDLTDRIGSALWKEFHGPNRPIAVLVERDIESIAAFLGIVKSHHFYVPIDSTQPLKRIQVILGQMQPLALIVNGNLPEGLEQVSSVPVREYGVLAAESADHSALEEAAGNIVDSDPLLAICTSGSTGVPKGVVKSHRTVLSFIPVFVQTFGFTSDDVFGNQAPFDFDVSVKDLYSTLYLGAEMFIIPRKCFSLPKTLMDVLDEKKISVLIWAVSALCVAAGLRAFKYKTPSSIRKVLFSGEVMPIRMLNIWREYIPDAMYVNLYGPTEVTGNILYYIVDREFADTDRLPLGRPFRNERVYVLNENNEPVGVGESGEICVVTPCMASGYYRNPEKTEAVFVQNPLNPEFPEKMYRTGDLAELTENGELYFNGRKDFMIKHMGHRIELEEIEVHLNAIEGIIRACCLFDMQNNKIVACYSGDLDKKEIVDVLKGSLPKYMIPTIFRQFETLPMNKNGKIDRAKLRELYFENA